MRVGGEDGGGWVINRSLINKRDSHSALILRDNPAATADGSNRKVEQNDIQIMTFAARQ